TRNYYRVWVDWRSRQRSRSRRGFLMNGRNVELRKAEPAGDIHRRHDGLMRGARIRAYRDRPALSARLFQERRPQGVGTRVDQGALVDAVAAVGGDGDHQGLMGPARQRNLARVWQLHLDAPLLLEGGRHHEENEKDEQDVDEVDHIDLGILPVARPQVHAVASKWPRSSSASTSFIASFSMRITRRSTLPRRNRYAMSDGIATVSPAAVVISASPMPPDSTRGSPSPLAVMALNAWMIPATVPSRPSSGATAAMVPRVLRKRSNSCTTWRPPSSSRSTINARGLLRLVRPIASSLPSGEFCSKATTSFSLSWSASIQFHTFCARSRGMTRLLCNVQRRSNIMATDAIEHRMIGHMKPPPARMISHIVSSFRQSWICRHDT